MHTTSTMISVRSLILFSLWLIAGGSRLAAEPAPVTPAARERALISSGHAGRIDAVLAKARRGEPICVAAIGGSITAGGNNTKDPSRRYVQQIAKWFEKAFPGLKVRFVNAGIGATNSGYGALRVQRDVIAHQPDLVVVEYAVNDSTGTKLDESYEGVLRQLLGSSTNRAVIELFFMHKDGNSAQPEQVALGRHYGLPMISFRDALWPDLQSGTIKWETIYDDVVHPNDAGHDIASELLRGFLATALEKLPKADRDLPAIQPLPAPLISDAYEHCVLFRAPDFKPLSSAGWSCVKSNVWECGSAGGRFEYEVPGRILMLGRNIPAAATNRVELVLDGGAPCPILRDGHNRPVATGLTAGPHRVTVVVHPFDGADKVQISWGGAAGLASKSPEKSAFTPRQWWLVGPYACYSAADFEANEAIENDGRNNERAREWNRVIGMGGRELRSIVVEGEPTGLVDLDMLLGPVPANVCAYAGVVVRAEKARTASATLTATGPVRWFLNNKLIAETKQAGVQITRMNLVAGLNCLLAKSWKTGAAWTVGCTLEGVPLTAETFPATSLPAKPLAGRRNVALWSEGSKVAVSSIVWRGFPINELGLNLLNDGRRDAGWTSLEVDQFPQWAWVRFPGLRKIDEVVVDAASAARRPLELVGEYTEDGGVTFKTLFHVTDPKDLSLRAKFPAVVTDNVRIRIDRVAVPEKSGFAQAQLTEIEVFGEDAVGDGSLAMVAAEPKENLVSRLEAEKIFKPTIEAGDAVTTVSTPWYRIALDQRRPRITQLQFDSLGKGEFKINLLRRSGATALLASLFDRPAFLADGALKMDANVARYPAVTVAPGVKLQLTLRFHEKSFDLELSTASARNVPLEGGVFRFDFDPWQTPTTFFGLASDRANFVGLPCYIHAPDAGTFHVTQTGDAAVLRQCASADNWGLSTRQFLNIAPRDGVLPAGVWRSTLHFDVAAPKPFPEIVEKEPRLAGLSRYALNIAQWTPSKRVLINNVASTPCPLSLQFYAEMATYGPVLADGISTMDLVIPSVDGYLNGLGGHLYWHGMKVEVTPPGTWTASLESPGFLINSAWHAVRTVGGRPLLDRWLPRLEAVAGHLEAHDTDGDGIVDAVDHGHWFDTYNLPPGVKEAHSTAVNYDAFRHLAELEELAGRADKAAHYRARAKLIHDNYLKMFFNPETGVIGGWRDRQGKLHDRMFPWVNGCAIRAGLVDDELAKSILAKFLAKMKEIGFTQYQYGLPTNLLPMQKDEWSHGARGWQDYMNGSITPPYSHYFIMALYRHGFRDEAERMLWAQVGSFDKGTFNSGVRIPHMPCRNPVGSAFFRWDGQHAEGEGYLPENWHAYASIFAGHYGIRFDETGYSLEPWSPLKGQRVRCGMPVMGKIQETME